MKPGLHFHHDFSLGFIFITMTFLVVFQCSCYAHFVLVGYAICALVGILVWVVVARCWFFFFNTFLMLLWCWGCLLVLSLALGVGYCCCFCHTILLALFLYIVVGHTSTLLSTARHIVVPLGLPLFSCCHSFRTGLLALLFLSCCSSCIIVALAF